MVLKQLVHLVNSVKELVWNFQTDGRVGTSRSHDASRYRASCLLWGEHSSFFLSAKVCAAAGVASVSNCIWKVAKICPRGGTWRWKICLVLWSDTDAHLRRQCRTLEGESLCPPSMRYCLLSSLRAWGKGAVCLNVWVLAENYLMIFISRYIKLARYN